MTYGQLSPSSEEAERLPGHKIEGNTHSQGHANAKASLA